MNHQSTQQPTILATKLVKTVGDATNPISILRDLNLSVSLGESVAIIGSSGSGKSTLLGLLAGLDNPTSGSVTVEGTPFSGLDEDARAAVRGKRMGFVFQSFQLLSTMTALENIMLPLQLANRRDAKQIATETLAPKTTTPLQFRVRHQPKKWWVVCGGTLHFVTQSKWPEQAQYRHSRLYESRTGSVE